MILGVGFILIAGIFPAALSQTESTSEETVAAALGREGAAFVSRLPHRSDPQVLTADPIGTLRPFDASPLTTTAGKSLWDMVRGNMIHVEDPRYAWVPFYRRFSINNVPLDYAQVFVLGVEVRGRSQYDPSLDTNASVDPAIGLTLLPFGILSKSTGPYGCCTVTTNPAGPDQLTLISSDPALQAQLLGAANQNGVRTGGVMAPGAFLFTTSDGHATTWKGPWIANAQYNLNDVALYNGTNYICISQTNGADPGTPDIEPLVWTVLENGWVFRVGDYLGNFVWQLQPGFDLTSQQRPAIKVLRTDFFVVGQGKRDPSAPVGPANPFQGGAQDISVYTTVVPLR